MAMIDQLAQRVNNTVKQSQDNRSVLTKVADFFTDDDLDKTKYLGEVSKAREDIWNSQIMPKLKAAKANDATVSQAYRTWSKQVDDWSTSNGFKLRQGQSINQQREQNMVQKLADADKSSSTSDKVAAKAKVAKVVTGTGLKSVQVGGLRAVGSIAQYVADAGETDRNSKRQKVANYVKRAGDEAKASNIAYQDIEQNGSEVSKIGLMAGEQVAPLVLTGGVAGATTKGALALGAGVKGAAAAGIGASTAVSYTQNYGDVRQGVEDEFRNATANQLATSKDPNTRTTFNSHYTKYLKKGLSQPDAAEQARLDTISDVAESYAEDYGKLVTALEPISAGAGKFGVKLAGGVVPTLVGKLATRAEQRAIGQAVRGQTSKVANATAMTKSVTGAIGRSAAEEGLQEGLTDWASQKAAVDSGIKASNDWGQTKEAAVYGAILGGLFGGGANIATGQTGYQQAKSQLSQIQQTQAATNAQLNTLQQQHSQLSQVANPTPEQKQQIQAIESNIRELETVKSDNETNAQRLNIPEPVLNKHVETPYNSTLNPQQAQTNNADNPATPDTSATAQTASPTDTTTNTSASPVNTGANPENPNANGGFDVNQYLDLDANSLEQAWVNHQQEMADNATITDGTDQMSVQDAIEHANNTIAEENTTPQVQGGISGVVARNQQRESQTILDNEMADWQAKKQQLQAERDAKLAQEMNTPDEPVIKLMDVNDGEHFDTTVIGLNGEPFRLANAWDSVIPAKAKQQAITTVFGGRLPQKLASASWGELHPQVQKKLHTWFAQELSNRRSEREQSAMPQLGMRTVAPQPVNELPSGNEPINLGFGDNQAQAMPVKQQPSNSFATGATSGDLFSQNSQDSQANIAAPKDVSIGADGKPKWFSTEQKANEFIAKKKIGDTHHVMQTDNKRFEILPKANGKYDYNTTLEEFSKNWKAQGDTKGEHWREVAQAIQSGKTVNPKVLEDHPDLKSYSFDKSEKNLKQQKERDAAYQKRKEEFRKKHDFKSVVSAYEQQHKTGIPKFNTAIPTKIDGIEYYVGAKSNNVVVYEINGERQSSINTKNYINPPFATFTPPVKVSAYSTAIDIKDATKAELDTYIESVTKDGKYIVKNKDVVLKMTGEPFDSAATAQTAIKNRKFKVTDYDVISDGERFIGVRQGYEVSTDTTTEQVKPINTQKAVIDEMQKSGRLEIVGLDNKPKAETPTSSNDLPIKNIGDTIKAKNGATYKIENINYTDMGGISSVGLTLLTFKDGSINPNKNPSIGTFTMGEFNRMFGGDFDLTPMPTAQDKTDNQADNAAKQRPSQSQGDGAGVGTNESQVAPKTENELAQYFANKLSPNLSVADIEDAIRDEIYLESRFNNPAVLDIAESEATYTAFAQKIKDLRKNREPHSTKYEQYQSPIISDDTFENTQQQTNGAKEIKFESNKNYQFEYDVNAALDADGFNQEGDFLRLDYKNKNQPLSAAKAYGARVFFSYNQTTGKVSSIVSVYTDSTHKRSIEITNEPNNQYPKVKFETEFYKPLFDVVAKDERAFQDYIDSGKWQAEKDAKREQIKQNFIDNKPAIFTDLAKKYMSASLVDLAGVETAEQFRGLSDESQAEAFAKLVEQTGYVPPKKKSKPTNVKEGIAKIQAEKKAAKKDKEKFADNKVFTADKVAAARARMKSKLSQLNSGLDPELMMDGMTIAGAYIESGVRKFGDYANAMIEDFGGNIKPYLLSFWESARHFPGLDTDGMTSVEDSKKEFDALMAKSDNEVNTEQDNTDDNSLRGTPRGRSDSTATASEPSQGTLAGISTDDVSAVPKTGDTTGQAQSSSRASVSSDESTRRSGIQTERSAGNRPTAVHPTATRSERVTPKPEQAVTADNTATDYPIAPPQTQENSQDFTISEDDEVGKGGLKTKFKQNLEAIKLLKQLQSENRQATKDEQKILTKWVGWGGLKAAFRRGDGSTVNGWAKEVEQLEAVLTPDELDAALNSTIAAHYTEPKIVKAMWKAVEKLGFNGGRVLEPSIGSGIFLGMLPASLRKSTAFYGTELDTITGGLAQQLYPTAAIKVMGFQDYSLQDGFFKVAIGNPPFANIKITDLDRKHLSGLSLHNYFFAKSLDALEDNGVLAMVVTSRLLDGADPKTRNYLFDNAELLMAVRLPNNAFKENANTDVTTDIIFLRKRSEAERTNGITNDFDYRGVGKFTDKNGDVVPLNNYFIKNPDHMLGEFGNFGTMYARGENGIETALVAPKGQNTLELLNKVLDKLPTGVITKHNKSDTLIVESMVKNIPEVKVGSMFEQDGNIYERTPDSMGDRQAVAVELPSQKAVDRVTGLIGLRSILSDVRQMQLSSNTDETVLEQRRAELNKAYDQFVKEHGHINSDANKRLFKEDPSWSQLSALEDNYDKGVSAAVSKNTGEPVKKPSAKKAAILERRTQYPFAEVTQVSSAKDGMIETLNSVGRLDLARISQLYGKNQYEVVKELGDLIYQDPVQGWVTADNYLSGNVKAKLAQAKEAMAQYGSDYERNVKALEQVQPQDIEAVDIEVRPGAHWIPANHITDFLKDVLGATGLQGVPTYSKFDNDWTLPKFIESAEAGTQFGTNRKSVRDIVTAAMNGKQVTVYDQIDRDTKVVNQEATNDANQKVEAVKRAWNDWIWMDDNRRDELAGLYNDIFNTDINQTYDGSHLKLLGKVDDNVIELRPTQKNAIWRITQNPTTLLDHVVGAGKTFTMVAAAMELRRMGLASKPMIVVPNHLVGQWGKEFIQLYPNANILVATKKDFEATNRKRLVARIANGDWDAVIVAHSSFGKIAVSPEFEAEFIKQQIQEISDAIEQAKQEAGKASNARDLANRKLKLEEKYKKLTASESRDTDNLYWDELGVDALMLDEAHEFKNLAYTTSSMNRVAGLGNQSGSQKAMDLFMKIQQLKQNPSSRIVFATGTPISNSMAEMYTMQRYLDMERMQNQGISGFDAWAKTFGEVINDWELSASGKYQMKSRFAKFVNMPELMQSYLGFADVINRDDINDALKAQGKKLPVPKIKGGAPQNTVVERSGAQADFIGVPRIENGREIYGEHTLIYRAEHLPKGQDAKKKGADNMLKIIGEARKAALDMRILDPNAPDFAGSKVNKAVENIMRIWRDTAADKGTQLVFCDLSTPKGSNNKEQAKLNELVRLADEGNEDAIAQLEKYTPDELDAIMNVNNFSVYDDMKQKLIAQGIPENEIAFIHDANTELQKDELFSKVRSGRIRVLLGSTSKMGAGTNVQTRLVALHHMDAPWRPSDLEQREGRIIRQGNELYAKDPENFEVEIHRYATEQTMDAMQWQIIENKAKFIEQVRKGDIKTRVIEDIEGEAANAGAMKAAASGNPLILEEMALKKQLNDLDSDKTRHDREQHRIKATIKRTKDSIESLENEQSRFTTLSQAKTPGDLDITIDGKNYKQGQEGARVEAGKAIVSQAIKASMSKEKLSVGQYGDFAISATANPTNRDSAILSLDYRGESIAMEVKHTDPAGGIITKLINRIKEIPDKLQQLKADLEKSIKAIPKLESQLKPWGKEAELDDIRRKHTEVMDALKPKKEEQAQPTDKPQYSKRELLAPNGKPSNLTPEQYAQVRTKEFKAWFGDWENDPDNASKVVDENGEPMVLYHGTKASSDFYEFDIDKLSSASGDSGYYGAGFYFTPDKNIALEYGKSIMPVFLNMKNPVYDTVESIEPLLPKLGIEKKLINVDKDWLTQAIKNKDKNAGILADIFNTMDKKKASREGWSLFKVRGGDINNNGLDLNTIFDIYSSNYHYLTDADFSFIEKNIGQIPESGKIYGYERIINIFRLTRKGIYANEFTEAALSVGRDGAVSPEKIEYVVFKPNQIKSATNNTGAFDPNNDDIRYSKNTKGATDTTPTQVRDTLVKQFGEKTIKALEDAGVLHIKQLSDFVDENGNLSIADDAEGFFHDGKAVLIADNIDANQIVPVFLHEVGGHAGLQNMLSPNAYANLMQTFDAMVARGDEIALRAKARAELASENQDQATTEYLPYLLSEISNAQAKTPFIKRLLDRFVGAVRAWVYAKTGVRMNLTHADILGLAELTINERARNIERTAKLIKQVNKQYSQPATNQSIDDVDKQKIQALIDQQRTNLAEVEYLDLDLVESIVQKFENVNIPSYSRRFAPIQQSPIPNKPAAKKAADWLNLQWATKWVSWDTFSRLIRRNIATPQHVAITHADYKKFWDLVQQRINYTNYEAANAVGLVPEILDKRLIIGQNKKDIEAVSKVIFDGTMNDVVYGDTELTRKGLTDKQIDLYRRVRQAINESVEKMAIDVLANSAKGTGLVSLDEILRIKEAVMSNGGNIGMFNKAMQQAVNNKIQAMLQAGVIDATKAGKLTTMFNEVAKQMDDVENRVYDLQDKGYAPLMRFGSYAVAVNDSKGDLVLYELYETKREQQKALHDLKKNPDYAGMTFNQNVLNPGDYQQFTNKGLNPETVMLFANELGLSNDEANQAYLKVAIAQQSALKRLIHRKKVAGFSEDLPRVLSAFVMSNARHSSRMLYNGDIEKSIQGVKDGDLRGEAQNLFENMENPAEEFASFRAMMFHWNMGFSPAFGLLNMTQPFIQTIPQLTIYDGVIGAHKSVLNGIRKAMASQVVEDAKGLGIAKNAKDFVDTIPSYMRDDYIRMTKEGHLDPQNVWLLQGLERGKAGVASGALGMVGQAAGYISEATETINRRATMYAALEIAHKLGAAKLKAKGFDSAYDFAVTTIQQTQGVYNKGNRSGLARSTGAASKFGAVIMMYKQFSINLIEQQIRMGQQKQGKALATAWVYQWLLAGAAGLIAADDLKDIIETIAFKFGYALNTDRKMQEFFIDTFGKEQGNDFYQMFNYGVLSSVSPIDFHGRSSAGNIIPATGLLHPSKAGDQKTEATEALGVGANWIGSMFDAGKLMMNGQFRDAMVTAAPRYVRDSVQAYEIATTGSMRDKNGRKVMDMTQGDAVAKALQFNPKSNAQRGRESMLNWQDKKLIENVKGDFTVKLAEAIASKDQAAQDKVMADIDKWNAKNDKQYQMDKTKITKSATDKAKKRDFTADERQTLPKSLEEYVNSLKKTG